ncbi:MAG TPA: hypothetical protein VMX97_08415 [Hyphomicrobiaceae bacterium]|nr:hypothetical protein [Hyphomicrobiaceae bacterium]
MTAWWTIATFVLPGDQRVGVIVATTLPAGIISAVGEKRTSGSSHATSGECLKVARFDVALRRRNSAAIRGLSGHLADASTLALQD